MEDFKNNKSCQIIHTTGEPIYEVGILALIIWKNQLYIHLKERLIHNVLHLINLERDGVSVEISSAYLFSQSLGILYL